MTEFGMLGYEWFLYARTTGNSCSRTLSLLNNLKVYTGNRNNNYFKKKNNYIPFVEIHKI